MKYLDHPHPDKRHVMRQMRRYLLAEKKRMGSKRGARSLIHYNDLVATYREAKRLVLAERT